MSRANKDTQHASTTDCRIPQNSPQLKIQILNCWIDTRLIHVLRDFTGFVQCTLQTCVKRFHSYPCKSIGSHVFVITRRDETHRLLLSHVESLTVSIGSSPGSNCFRALTLCNNIRVVHTVLSWRSLSASSVLTVI